MHHEYTNIKRLLKLEDIAGLPVGHVPRSLAGYFRTILDDKGQVFAQITGEPVPSFAPWPAPTSKCRGWRCCYTMFLYHGRTRQFHS